MASASSTPASHARRSRLGRQQPLPGRRPVRRPAHAARGQQPRQQRVHAGLFEREAHARRHVAGLQDHRRSRVQQGAPSAGGAASDAALPQPSGGIGPGRRAAFAAQRELHRPPALHGGSISATGRRPASPGLAQAGPVFGQRGAAQALVDARRDARHGLRHAAAAEPERVHRQQAARLALVVQRVRVQQHLHLVLQAAHAAAPRGRWQPAVDVAADHAVQRGGGQPARLSCATYQRSGAPQCSRKPSLVNSGARRRTFARGGLVQRAAAPGRAG
jgi:hypothetical protein